MGKGKANVGERGSLGEGFERRRVGVLGAGTMGSGIAITVARAGHEVIMRDVSEERVQGGPISHSQNSIRGSALAHE